MPGRYLEEFAVGEVIRHSPSKTLTQAENALFCSFTFNPQALHLDELFAKSLGHPGPVVNGVYTLGLLLGLSVSDTTQGTTLGNLAMSVEYDAPTFPGDTVTAISEVVSVRPSSTKPDRGVVGFTHRLFNQDGEVVVTCHRSGMIMRRPFEGA